MGSGGMAGPSPGMSLDAARRDARYLTSCTSTSRLSCFLAAAQTASSATSAAAIAKRIVSTGPTQVLLLHFLLR